MLQLVAALLGLSVLLEPISEKPPPGVIHYPINWMGDAADANDILWYRIYRKDGRPMYMVKRPFDAEYRLYHGIASTPLCHSHYPGGIITGEFWNRKTKQWEWEKLVTADVSKDYDRPQQLAWNNLVEVNWEDQDWRGYTTDRGYGRGPLRNWKVWCP